MPTLSAMMSRSLRQTALVPLLVAFAVLVAACGSSDDLDALPEGVEYGDSLDEFLDETEVSAPEASDIPDGFTEILWDTLVPPGSTGAEVSARYAERIAGVEPGSAEAAEVFDLMQAEYAASNNLMNTDLAGEAVQLAGFVAPLTFTGDLITEFLLVPYFGACIHVPPPPPNQTVLVSLEAGQGLTIDESWGPVWVTGTLSVESFDTDLATAGYAISGAQTGIYNQY